MIEKFVLLLLKLVAALPLSVVQGIGRFVGFIFGHVVRHHRKDALVQLERSIPELPQKERKRIINTMYYLQGVNLLEMVWYSIRGLETVAKAVEIEGEENFIKAQERGKGVLVLTGHVSNFELMPMATASAGYKLSVIVKRIKNKSVNSMIELLRSHEGLTFLSTKNAYRDCLKALRRNEAVGMIIDQNMTRNEGVFVDFFGKPACSSPGLAFLAAQSKAPIVPAFMTRKPDGGFVFKVYPMIEPPEDRQPETIHTATQAYNLIVEQAIREAPEQWIWMHRRWKTIPLEGNSHMIRAKG